jgi:hypothetical protein
MVRWNVVGACIGVGLAGASALAQADEATPKTAAAPAQIHRPVGEHAAAAPNGTGWSCTTPAARKKARHHSTVGGSTTRKWPMASRSISIPMPRQARRYRSAPCQGDEPRERKIGDRHRARPRSLRPRPNRRCQPQDRRKIGDGDGRRGSRDCRADRRASARWHSEGRRGRHGSGSHGPFDGTVRRRRRLRVVSSMTAADDHLSDVAPHEVHLAHHHRHDLHRGDRQRRANEVTLRSADETAIRSPHALPSLSRTTTGLVRGRGRRTAR